MKELSTIFFNAHHSPIGAFATFTLGQPSASGGMGLEIGKPADQDIYIGVEDESGDLQTLPFYEQTESEDSERFDVSGNSDAHETPEHRAIKIYPFTRDTISRDYRVSTDTWTAGALAFRLISPVMSVPDPVQGDDAALKFALIPAILAEITVDNSNNSKPRRAVFGFAAKGELSGLRRMDDVSGGRFVGIGQGLSTAIVSRDEGVASGLGFSMSAIVNERIPENLEFALGSAAALIMTVPAGELKTFKFAICFYRGGNITAGMESTYYYTRFFESIEQVASYALESYDALAAAAQMADDWIDNAPLSSDQRFLLTHGIRSYYGSTQLLQDPIGRPIWIVNEGEYRMMNTLDLTVDHAFFEMALNPWVLRNALNFFADRYSYHDKIRLPGGDTLFDGGISFAHDTGVANVFSRPKHSAYEKYGLRGCFSHMTHEQLVNWLCCALMYGQHDPRWLSLKMVIVEDCFHSMLVRDHPDAAQRNGIMSLDSDRCKGGSEITTYDSLDPSLSQARGSVYLAGKCWAAYVGLAKAFRENNRDEFANQADAQAKRCADTIAAALSLDGTLPAVIGEDVPARIIPAIEGLAFPGFLGCPDATSNPGPYAGYIAALKSHLSNVLNDETCLFPSGGWKLSSTSDNSCLSKICLCQYIARHVLNIQDATDTASADAVHVSWLLDPQNTYWCWSDQMINGIAEGSRYYPRGVTAILWLSENGYPTRP